MTFAGIYHSEPIIIEPLREIKKEVQNPDWEELKIDLSDNPKFLTYSKSLDFEVEAIFDQDEIKVIKERHQNSGEIPYLYNVKIESVTPSPSIFTGEFHPYV